MIVNGYPYHITINNTYIYIYDYEFQYIPITVEFIPLLYYFQVVCSTKPLV